jgi:lysozyme family protein
MAAFDQAFAAVIGSEGGYSANPADPGNWTGGSVGAGACRGTKYGISAAAYPGLDIANLTQAQAQAIYRSDYWDKLQSDTLPPPLALLLFDAAVNNGPARAVRWLQAVLGCTQDGVMGPATLAAVAAQSGASGGAAICSAYLAQRLLFMTALPTWKTFRTGWAERLCRLPYQSVAMSS